MLKAALLDGDGVLVDSEGTYQRAVNEALKHYEIEIGVEEYVRIWMVEQRGMVGVIEDYGLDKKGITARQLIDERDAILHEYIDQGMINKISDADNLVEMLYSMCPLGLVTSDSERNAKKKLEVPGFWEVFKVRVMAGDTERSKPYPDPYHKGVELLREIVPNLMPQEVLVVEDNPTGVKSAKEADCRVIAFPNGYTRDMKFEGDSEPDRIVYRLADIDDNMLRELFHDI